MRKPSTIFQIKPALKRTKKPTISKSALLAGYKEARKKLVVEIELLTKRADAAAAGLKKIQEKINSLN
jgi:hypothetical protein